VARYAARVNVRFTVLVDVDGAPDGTLRLHVRPVDPAVSVCTRSTLLTVTLWTDGDDVVRASVQHAQTRSLAYVQGNRALRELVHRIGVQRAERPA